MTAVEISFELLEAVLWYAFFWVGLDAIKNKRNTWIAALCLLILGTLAFVACPWARDTRTWEQLIQ